MAKQAPDTDKGRDTVRDQTRFFLNAINIATILNYSNNNLINYNNLLNNWW